MTTNFIPAPDVSIDPKAIAAHCKVLFGYLEGLAPIRLLGESGTPNKPGKFLFPDVSGVADKVSNIAADAAAEQRAVFVVPGTVIKPGKARAEDISQTGVILVDLDTGDIEQKRDHVARYLGTPTLEIASGGVCENGMIKRHLYWRLKEAACGNDLPRVAQIRANIAARIGGDPSFGSLHQPIRVAGTVHGKNGVQSPVTILKCCDAEYELSDLEDRVLQMPSLAGSRIKSDLTSGQKRGPGVKDLAITPIHAGAKDELTRFEALSRVIGHWLRTARSKGVSLDEAWDAVRNHNAAMIRPPWPEDRLRNEFDALLRRDVNRYGAFPTTASQDNSNRQNAMTGSSEDALADRFAVAHGASWRFVASWGTWLHWSGVVWEQDEPMAVREEARHICRVAAAVSPNASDARRIASDKTISACLRIASSDPRLATRTSDWDAHPLLLNTPSGIIDLTSGEVLPNDPTLLLTQITSASLGQDCPRWMQFLAEITAGDAELEAYLKRLAGYCLTGSTKEQVFAFLHGVGANGKSVFLSTIAHVLGDYSATATLDTFMASPNSRHLTELAGLRAARLVIVPETEQGRSWAEARIKTVTGGEKIRANFMRQNHFEFEPQFKLLIAGNHRPQLSGHGEAMRRRLHLVPFEVTIPETQRDPDLTDKLRKERDGILGWMVEGCCEWQRSGLAAPQGVLDAAAQYFDEEDLTSQWVEACCQEDSGNKAEAKTLFASWKSWAETAGAEAGSIKTFGAAMRSRGYRSTQVNRSRGWQGISLRHTAAGKGDSS